MSPSPECWEVLLVLMVNSSPVRERERGVVVIETGLDLLWYPVHPDSPRTARRRFLRRRRVGWGWRPAWVWSVLLEPRLRPRSVKKKQPGQNRAETLPWRQQLQGFRTSWSGSGALTLKYWKRKASILCLKR